MKFLNAAVDVFPYPLSVVLFSDDLFQVKRVDGVCSLTVRYLFKMGLSISYSTSVFNRS